ncbi:MAG: hypothetical protein ABWY25_07700 [Paenisporosarcina sp.]
MRKNLYGVDDPRFLATVELIQRTGIQRFQIRYHDDEEPLVWIAVAGYKGNWEAGAGLNPLTAVWRLAEALIDGGQCQHCSRPAGITNDWTGEMPMSGMICWYIYDPELETYRRSCEGDK